MPATAETSRPNTSKPSPLLTEDIHSPAPHPARGYSFYFSATFSSYMFDFRHTLISLNVIILISLEWTNHHIHIISVLVFRNLRICIVHRRLVLFGGIYCLGFRSYSDSQQSRYLFSSVYVSAIITRNVFVMQYLFRHHIRSGEILGRCRSAVDTYCDHYIRDCYILAQSYSLSGLRNL